MGAVTMLPKGANVGVPTGTVRAVVRSGSALPLDVCAVLLTGAGSVRSDDDFVFFNQPRHRCGAVGVAADEGGGTLTVALAAIEPDITSVVLAGSVDDGTFAGLGGLLIQVVDDAGGLVAGFRPDSTEPVTTMVFGELYRRGAGWKFRAVGQGWSSGLAGLARSYGISVEEPDEPDEPDEPGERPDQRSEPRTAPSGSPAPAPVSRREPAPPVPLQAPVPDPGPARPADWYPDPDAAGRLRWWDGMAWTTHSRPPMVDTATACGRCGAQKRRRPFAGRPVPCASCDEEIRRLLWDWQHKVTQVVGATPGTPGAPGPAALAALWAELRFHAVPRAAGEAVYRSVGLGHLQRVVTFAFGDGVIEDSEVAFFENEVRRLGLHDPAVEEMRRWLRRGLELSRIRGGQLPRVHSTTLHLDLDEFVHLDVATVQVRQLASGPRETPGRLVASSRKLRFLGRTGGGNEIAWQKIVEVTAGHGRVDIAATTSRGGGRYQVDDPEYVAAVLSGALRVARRLVIAPGARDSRAIPQAVKAEVWQRDGGACVQCQATEYLEFDHVIPHSRGGATSVNNLQLLCRRCNQEKGARI
ncbi:TerD family protein [Frankia sp. QA3]|uniref:TerD family protein n=1 Tax=Frankia sp. QA3 TaxID=710111 RepID=UPI00056668FB|nr:TerD family protein [Frankia sp. QA3]